MRLLRSATLIASILVLGACGGDEREPEPAVVEEEATGGMDGMPGMPGMGMQDGMMEQMTAHMQRMHGAGPDSMAAMLPMHRQMVANMIAQMNREMRDMNMTGDAQWNATVDSLRDDLKRMPEMSGPELQALMPRHHERVTRLVESHRAMMADMKM